jgi:hypothetical protein
VNAGLESRTTWAKNGWTEGTMGTIHQRPRNPVRLRWILLAIPFQASGG